MVVKSLYKRRGDGYGDIIVSNVSISHKNRYIFNMTHNFPYISFFRSAVFQELKKRNSHTVTKPSI